MTLLQRYEPGLTDQLRMTVIKLSRHLRRECQAVGLSVLDTQVLSDIYRMPGIGVTQLATLEQVGRPSMSSRIRKLTELGWVVPQAEAPQGDLRRTGLSLTRKGLQALRELETLQNEWLDSRLALLNDAQLKIVREAIEPLVDLLEDRLLDDQQNISDTERRVLAKDRELNFKYRG